MLFRLFFMGIALVLWKLILLPSVPFSRSKSRTAIYLLFMYACMCALYFAIAKWSSPSVRGDDGALSHSLMFAILIVAFSQYALAFAGVSIHDDVAERNNLSAAFSAAGFTLGVTCCVAGANIGDGPGFEVVLFCAALSVTTLLLFWVFIAQASGVVEEITIERDLGTGIRCGGWLAGSGAVLGACVAGDWISLAATMRDFLRFAWPVAVFAFLFASFERRIYRRSTARRPSMTSSALIAAAMVVGGAVYAEWIGRH